MMLRVPAATLAAALLVSGTALAEPAAPPDKAEMQRHFAEACKDRLAHATGELAYLEAKLALSEQQKPLFERWKKVKLTAVKAAGCVPPPDDRPSIVDHLKQEEKMLHQRLDELKAELPALQALVASLSDEQRKAFEPPLGMPGPHRGPHSGQSDGDQPGGRGHPQDGPDAPPPPPEH